MKIGILSRSPKIYSTARLVEAAEERGHEVMVVNPLKCYMNITGNHPYSLTLSQLKRYFKLEVENYNVDWD